MGAVKKILLLFIFSSACLVAEEKPILNVYAPGYFSSEWGPGPILEESFEEVCGCDLQFFTGDLLPRIRLEGGNIEADVVIGLDTGTINIARKTNIFLEHNQNLENLTMPIPWNDKVFLPFNWSYFSFVYNNNKLKNVPSSFNDLISDDASTKIIIQDPRTSVSGLGLVLWVKAVYGEDAKSVWTKLEKKIVTVTKGWSEAYGLFLDGEADMVFSFTTSPAYHLIAEGDDTKSAAIFEEGHYLFVETLAKTKRAVEKPLADMFIRFVLSENFQTKIPTSNWSYPAALDHEKLPSGFQELPKPQISIILDEEDVSLIRDGAIKDWEEGLIGN